MEIVCGIPILFVIVLIVLKLWSTLSDWLYYRNPSRDWDIVIGFGILGFLYGLAVQNIGWVAVGMVVVSLYSLWRFGYDS